MKEVILFRDRAVTQQGRMTTDRCSLAGDRLGHMKTQEHLVPNPALSSLLLPPPLPSILGFPGGP